MIHTKTFRAMGCQMLAAIDSPSPTAGGKLERVPGWFEAWEQSLSRFRGTSELSRLNQGAGEPAAVSQPFWEVLQAALRAYEESGGLVSPAVYDALLAAGYTRSFDPGSSPRPAPIEPPAAAQPELLAGLQMDHRNRTVTLPAGLRLDFGGIAKGWAAHQAAQRLKAYGPALVDAGGDIAVSGLQADGEPWPVGVADPFHPEENLEVLLLGRGGVATSGRDYRKWQQGGVWKHHIIDPRTGQPAATDVLTATVIAPNVMDAEIAAKVLLVLGSRSGLEWIEARPSLSALLVLEDGRCLPSSRFERIAKERSLYVSA
jgi:thiamine biosynthesis lipoprotein